MNIDNVLDSLIDQIKKESEDFKDNLLEGLLTEANFYRVKGQLTFLESTERVLSDISISGMSYEDVLERTDNEVKKFVEKAKTDLLAKSTFEDYKVAIGYHVIAESLRKTYIKLKDEL